MADYLKRLKVRKEAGFQNSSEPGETLSGVIDGVNKTFAVANVPIVDNDGDDNVSATDVIVRVDGVPVNISTIDAATGVIVLAAIPPADSEITVQYWYSDITDADVDEVISEAEGIVNDGIRDYVTVPLSAEDKNFSRARRVAVYYASGFILIRDYGKNTDTEETSKDGYAKLDLADKMLKALAADLASDSTEGGSGVIMANKGFHVFGNREACDPHDRFMRKRC